MSWRATHMLAAGLSAIAASAQAPPVGSLVPPLPGAHAQPERAWIEFMKSHGTDQRLVIPQSASLCSIPLKRIPVVKNAIPMPVLRPRKPVEPMPLVPLPAPPCKEEKR